MFSSAESHGECSAPKLPMGSGERLRTLSPASRTSSVSTVFARTPFFVPMISQALEAAQPASPRTTYHTVDESAFGFCRSRSNTTVLGAGNGSANITDSTGGLDATPLSSLRAEFAALKSRLSKQMQQLESQTTRLMQIVIEPLEAKLGSLEGKYPVLDWEISDLFVGSQKLGEDFDRLPSFGSGEDKESDVKWKVVLRKDAQQPNEGTFRELQGKLVDFVTEQDPRMRISQPLPYFNCLTPVNALGQAMKLETARSGVPHLMQDSPAALTAQHELKGTFTALETSLKETGASLLLALEAAAASLQDHLRASAHLCAHAAPKLSDDIGVQLTEDTRRTSCEVADLKADDRSPEFAAGLRRLIEEIARGLLQTSVADLKQAAGCPDAFAEDLQRLGKEFAALRKPTELPSELVERLQCLSEQLVERLREDATGVNEFTKSLRRLGDDVAQIKACDRSSKIEADLRSVREEVATLKEAFVRPAVKTVRDVELADEEVNGSAGVAAAAQNTPFPPAGRPPKGFCRRPAPASSAKRATLLEFADEPPALPSQFSALRMSVSGLERKVDALSRALLASVATDDVMAQLRAGLDRVKARVGCSDEDLPVVNDDDGSDRTQSRAESPAAKRVPGSPLASTASTMREARVHSDGDSDASQSYAATPLVEEAPASPLVHDDGEIGKPRSPAKSLAVHKALPDHDEGEIDKTKSLAKSPEIEEALGVHDDGDTDRLQQPADSSAVDEEPVVHDDGASGTSLSLAESPVVEEAPAVHRDGDSETSRAPAESPPIDNVPVVHGDGERDMPQPHTQSPAVEEAPAGHDDGEGTESQSPVESLTVEGTPDRHLVLTAQEAPIVHRDGEGNKPRSRVDMLAGEEAPAIPHASTAAAMQDWPPLVHDDGESGKCQSPAESLAFEEAPAQSDVQPANTSLSTVSITQEAPAVQDDGESDTPLSLSNSPVVVEVPAVHDNGASDRLQSIAGSMAVEEAFAVRDDGESEKLQPIADSQAVEEAPVIHRDRESDRPHVPAESQAVEPVIEPPSLSVADHTVALDASAPNKLEEQPAPPVDEGKAVKAGMQVIVLQSMLSNTDEPVKLRVGQCGYINAVDEDGDALVLFEDVEKAQWIFKANLSNVLITDSESPEESADMGRRVLDSSIPLDTLANSKLRSVAMAAGLSVADCLTRELLVERAEEAKAELQRAPMKERTTPLPTGVRLQYNSPSQQRWLDCRVNAVNEAGSVRIDIKPGHWFTLAEQSVKFRPKPFTDGQTVMFRPAEASEAAAWEETTIAAVRDDGAVRVGCASGRWISTAEQLDVIRQKEALPFMCIGDAVVVARNFRSDSEEPVRLVTGQRGVVQEVDEDGDALIAFESHKAEQWVIESNFDKLYITSVASEEDAPAEKKKSGDLTSPRDERRQVSSADLEAANAVKNSSCRSSYMRGAAVGAMRPLASNKRRGSVVIRAEDFISDNAEAVPSKSQAVSTTSQLDERGDMPVEVANDHAHWVKWVSMPNQENIKLVAPSADSVKKNSRIYVTQDFMSDSVDSRRIKRNSTGRVKEIDGDGDMLVEFGKGQCEWVATSNLDKVAVVDQGDSEVGSPALGSEKNGFGPRETRDREPRRSGLVWAPGCVVIAKNDFMSDNLDPTRVNALTEGKVMEIDADGDALVDFGNQCGPQWVALAHRERLAVVKGVAPQLMSVHSTGKMQVGQRVVVRSAFMADSTDRMLLEAGLGGRIEKIDPEGDRLIHFDNIRCAQWVFASNLDNLAEVAAKDMEGEDTGENSFSPGMEAFYHSTSHGRWIPCLVDHIRQDGAVQLDVKPGVWITLKTQRRQLRKKNEALFKVGDTLLYNSTTLGKWVDVEVTKARPNDGAIQIDAKEGSWLSIADQIAKLKPRFAVEGMVVEVIREMMSDSESNQVLMVGRRGVVQEIDEEGDALIKFHGSTIFDWVYKSKLDNLAVISCPDGSSKASAASDPKDLCRTIRVGATVAVLEGFSTDSEQQVSLKKGQRGVVKEVDEEGDMLVQFDGELERQWVFKDKAEKLAVVRDATAGEHQTLKQYLES